jgi:hypothetical protein
VTTRESRSNKATSALGMNIGIAIGTGSGIAIGAAWDLSHQPTE